MGSISKAGRSFLSQIGKQNLARNAPLRRLLPVVAIKRHDSIFTKYREPPNGFLFNEKVYFVVKEAIFSKKREGRGAKGRLGKGGKELWCAILA